MTELQSRFLEKNTLFIEGSVDLKMFEYVKECIQTFELKGWPEINVRISSHGGSVVHGFWIYDLIRSYQGNSIAVILGECNSVASVILQACKVRKAYKHSTIIIHDLGNSKRMTVKDYDDGVVKLQFETLRQDQNRMLEIYCNKTGRQEAEIDKVLKQDRIMYMIEAKELGLIDEII